MLSIYLAPASIGCLIQFMLSLASAVFLALRLRKNRAAQPVLLTFFFASVAVLIELLFLNAALLPCPRLFACRFPRQFPRHTWEARAGLFVSLACLLWEASYTMTLEKAGLHRSRRSDGYWAFCGRG